MLGLTRRQARERFDDVIAFAELQNFLDLKLKNYSSGMSVRLAFSVAIQVDADVLLVDEVLAVGDAAFQHKCFEQFHRLKAEGKTIIFVTHDMSAVERFCDRAILLEKGKAVLTGEPHAVARAYNELNFGRLVQADDDGEPRFGDRTTGEIRAAWFENAAGERVASIQQGEPMSLCTEVAFHSGIDEPAVHFHLRNEARQTIFATSTELEPVDVGSYAAGEGAIVRARMDNWLAPGRYNLSPTLTRRGGANAIDVREGLTSIVVFGSRHTGGAVEIPHRFEVERRS
jgi:ABC-type multidrug transport system ATPase subunit